MDTPPTENNIKTVLELDLASYSDIARALEENLDVHAVKAFEDQVQSFVDQGLAHVGLRREDVVLGSAGDNAILVFDEPSVMHRFAEAVQHLVAAHNGQKSVESAKRWFRMGAATGPVLLLQAERRIVGTTVARAVRLEAAAKNGQILVDVATYDSLPDSLKGFYGEEEGISGKRDERFIARRCTFVPMDEPAWGHWTAVAAAFVILAIPIVWYAFARLTDYSGPVKVAPFKGWIDVRVWEPNNDRRRGLRLRDPGALPLKANDQVRIEAKLNRPGYLYVLWIDTEGKVSAVYPWVPGHWDNRPAEERPIADLSLPEAANSGWPIKRGPAGMETLLMLVRGTPFPSDTDLLEILTGLPRQKMQNQLSAVWFENGEAVHDEGDRGPNFFDVQQIDDPVLRTQRLLKEKLGPLCEYSRAVSFANEGK